MLKLEEVALEPVQELVNWKGRATKAPSALPDGTMRGLLVTRDSESQRSFLRIGRIHLARCVGERGARKRLPFKPVAVGVEHLCRWLRTGFYPVCVSSAFYNW